MTGAGKGLPYDRLKLASRAQRLTFAVGAVAAIVVSLLASALVAHGEPEQSAGGYVIFAKADAAVDNGTNEKHEP